MQKVLCNGLESQICKVRFVSEARMLFGSGVRGWHLGKSLNERLYIFDRSSQENMLWGVWVDRPFQVPGRAPHIDDLRGNLPCSRTYVPCG